MEMLAYRVSLHDRLSTTCAHVLGRCCHAGRVASFMGSEVGGSARLEKERVYNTSRGDSGVLPAIFCLQGIYPMNCLVERRFERRSMVGLCGGIETLTNFHFGKDRVIEFFLVEILHWGRIS